jgi:hypothetical protein
VTALDGVAGALFGEGLRVLPRFAPVGPFADLVARLLDPAASVALLGGDALAPERWLSRAARVREPAAAWRDVLRQAGILQGRSLEAWQVAQLPVAAAPGAERWVGRPLGEPLARPRTSLVAHVAAPGGSPAGGYCGLFVDGWSEVVPAATETTGVSFHFDTPGARAPNAWLLAVSPAPGGPGRAWSLDHLEAVLRELLVLVKIRGVDPSLLEELDSFLPAVYVAENAAGGVVATDLDRAGVGR